MKERLEQIKNCALEAIQSASGMDELNEVKVKYLGKKGELSQLLKGMKNVAPEERPKVGQMVNDAIGYVLSCLVKHRYTIARKRSTLQLNIHSRFYVSQIWNLCQSISLKTSYKISTSR